MIKLKPNVVVHRMYASWIAISYLMSHLRTNAQFYTIEHYNLADKRSFG